MVNRFPQTGQYAFDTSGLWRLDAAHVEVMHHKANPCDGGLFQPKARRQDLERDTAADMAERRAIEVEAQRIRRAVRRGCQPKDARLRVDEAPDQPCAGEPINPRTCASGPGTGLVIQTIQAGNSPLYSVRLVRRQRAGASLFQFTQRTVRLTLSLAGVEVDFNQRSKGFAKLTHLPQHVLHGIQCQRLPEMMDID